MDNLKMLEGEQQVGSEIRFGLAGKITDAKVMPQNR